MHEEKKKNHAFFERNSWYHRIKILTEDGKTKYSKKGGFKTAEEAEKSYKKYEKEYKDSLKSFVSRSVLNAEIMLSDYLDFWQQDIYGLRVENSTRVLANYIIENWIKPYIETDIKMKHLNEDFLNDLLERASKASRYSGSGVQNLLNIALKDAINEQIISYNPMIDAKKYPRSKPKVRVLGKSSLKRFLLAASGTNWFLEILLALFCGLRKGEILGLKFLDFDFENGTMYIQRQLSYNPILDEKTGKKIGYQVIEKEPKTENSYRKMKVPYIILEELEYRNKYIDECKLKFADKYKDYGYVSCQENGEPRSQAAMNTAITKICKRNGIPHISVHGLRHMFATILLENGVSLAKISALMGHSSIYTTFEYYCDIMNENDKIIDFLNERFPVYTESEIEDE